MSTPHDPSFEPLIAATGLPDTIAMGVLRRALKDTGGTEPPSRADWTRALPRIEARMRAYVGEPVAKERAKIIAATIATLP